MGQLDWWQISNFLLPPCFLRSDLHDAASFKARSLVETMSQDVKHIGLDGEPRIAGCNEKLRYEVQLQVKARVQRKLNYRMLGVAACTGGLGSTLFPEALVQALTSLDFKIENDSPNTMISTFKPRWDKKSQKLGVWRRHIGLKEGKLPAVPSIVQLLSNFLCQPLEKTKLDRRKKMPQANAGKSRNCFKQILADDAFRQKSPTNTAQTKKQQPRCIHASCRPCTQRACGPQSLATRIMMSVWSFDDLMDRWFTTGIDQTTTCTPVLTRSGNYSSRKT